MNCIYTENLVDVVVFCCLKEQKLSIASNKY